MKHKRWPHYPGPIFRKPPKSFRSMYAERCAFRNTSDSDKVCGVANTNLLRKPSYGLTPCHLSRCFPPHPEGGLLCRRVPLPPELPLTLIPPLRWIPASFADLHRCPSAVVPSLPSCPGEGQSEPASRGSLFFRGIFFCFAPTVPGNCGKGAFSFPSCNGEWNARLGVALRRNLFCFGGYPNTFLFLVKNIILLSPAR